MEALLAVSGLLAALGVGAVGVGYARSRAPGVGFSLVTTTNTNTTATRDAQGNILIASGVVKVTVEDSGGATLLVSTYSPGQTSAVDRRQVAEDMVAKGLTVFSENGIGAILGQATAADFTRSTVQPTAVQEAVAGSFTAAQDAAGTNQATLDVELDAYIDDGFTLTEAEAAVKAGGQSDPYADLQTKVYPGYTGSYNAATDKIVRVPWAPPGALASVGTPGGPSPTNYGLVVPK